MFMCAVIHYFDELISDNVENPCVCVRMMKRWAYIQIKTQTQTPILSWILLARLFFSFFDESEQEGTNERRTDRRGGTLCISDVATISNKKKNISKVYSSDDGLLSK